MSHTKFEPIRTNGFDVIDVQSFHFLRKSGLSYIFAYKTRNTVWIMIKLHTLIASNNVYLTYKFQCHTLKDKVTTEGTNNSHNAR